MRLSAIEAAGKFVEEQFPHCVAALLAGSAARGEETETSDLDIVIFTTDTPYRESLIRYGWRIEAFVHTETSYLEWFESERRVGRATLANMIAGGIVIKDTGFIEAIKNKAEQWIAEGPPLLTEDFIRASRYFIYDLLDDFRDAKTDPEAIITVNTLSLQLGEFILRLNGQWIGRGKGLARQLFKFDVDLANQFFDALDAFYRHRATQPLIEFVDRIYAPLGGQLFDGFKQA